MVVKMVVVFASSDVGIVLVMVVVIVVAMVEVRSQTLVVT